MFLNKLTPLFWTYLVIPRNIGPRNKRGCFKHPPNLVNCKKNYLEAAAATAAETAAATAEDPPSAA